MFKFYSVIFCIGLSGICSAQTKDLPIVVQSGFFNNCYFIGENEYSKSDIKQFLLNNEITENLIKSSNSEKIWAWIILGCGVAVTSQTIYSAWRESNNYGTSPLNSSSFIIMAGLSVALDITGILLISSSNKKVNRAIAKYNKSLPTGYDNLNLNFNGLSLSLTLRL